MHARRVEIEPSLTPSERELLAKAQVRPERDAHHRPSLLAIARAEGAQRPDVAIDLAATVVRRVDGWREPT